MYEVLSGEREVGGKTIDTFKREIYSCYYVNKVDNLNRGDSTEIGILILKWR